MKKGLLIIIAIAILAAGGWLFLRPEQKNNTKTQPSSTSKSQNLKTYSNAHVSLQYPTSWKIVEPSGSPEEYAVLEGPTDADIPIKDYTKNIPLNRRLRLYIGQATTQQTCREECKVYDVISLHKANAPAANLVISDWDSQGAAQMMILSNDMVSKGQTSYNISSTINDHKVYIYADIMYGNDYSNGLIMDVPAFEKSRSFKELISILTSVNIK